MKRKLQKKGQKRFQIRKLRFGEISGSIFESLPISVVETLELRRNVHEIIGCVLFGSVNEGCVGTQMAFGEIIGARSRVFNNLRTIRKIIGTQKLFHGCYLTFLRIGPSK